MAGGGYRGGSTVIGPRSSWFGRSQPKPKASKKEQPPQQRKRKKRKGPSLRKTVGSATIRDAEEARRRGLTKSEWLSRASKRVEYLQTEVRKLEYSLEKVRKQLRDAEAEESRAKGG